MIHALQELDICLKEIVCLIFSASYIESTIMHTDYSINLCITHTHIHTYMYCQRLHTLNIIWWRWLRVIRHLIRHCEIPSLVLHSSIILILLYRIRLLWGVLRWIGICVKVTSSNLRHHISILL